MRSAELAVHQIEHSLLTLMEFGGRAECEALLRVHDRVLGWETHGDSAAKIVEILMEEIGGDRCPKCGSTLNKRDGKAWCSFVGGRTEKACDYGIRSLHPSSK
jgi:hypothetical protein